MPVTFTGKKQSLFWRDVRTYWSQVYESSQTFEVKKRVDGELMFATLFDMADRPMRTVTLAKR